jgi:hypothetical protein
MTQRSVIQSASAFAAAARETGLEQIVGLSQWLAGPNHPALMSRQLWLIDRMFATLPRVAHTVVNPGFFADSPYLEMMPFAAHLGVFPLRRQANRTSRLCQIARKILCQIIRKVTDTFTLQIIWSNFFASSRQAIRGIPLHYSYLGRQRTSPDRPGGVSRSNRLQNPF